MSIKLEGNWTKGLAFDVHMLSSVYLGPDESGHKQFENTRSEMGQHLYQLKYGGDKSAIQKIVDLLEKIKGIEKFDAIIPVPATAKGRAFQPVDEIALELGKRNGVKVLVGLLAKKPGGAQLKNVDDPEKRIQMLEKTIAISSDHDIAGKEVLLVDDLYRSGATLSVAANILLTQAKVKGVCVLTMTKTKSNR